MEYGTVHGNLTKRAGSIPRHSCLWEQRLIYIDSLNIVCLFVWGGFGLLGRLLCSPCDGSEACLVEWKPRYSTGTSKHLIHIKFYPTDQS